jgi:hypothetical protein
MANQITQRLIAAGASPQKAQAFASKFTQKLQSAQPTITKPQDIQDAFDAEIAAFAAAAYPRTFKPPAIDDPRIDAYITGIYGKDKLKELENKTYSTEAPNFIRIKNTLPKDANAYNLDQYIIAAIGNQQSYAQIVNDIIEKAPIELMGSLSQGQVADTVNKYYNEYNKAIETIPVNKQKLLESNKYYKVGLPDPSFQYGTTENLSAGVIDFRTHPSVTRILEEKKTKNVKDLQSTYGAAGPQSSAAAGIAVPSPQEEIGIFNQLSATKATPFVDEVKRREYLKKRQTK